MSDSQRLPIFLPSDEAINQSRLIPSYLQNQVNCELCAYEYDLSQRVPMMLCNSQHNCCLSCVKEIIIRKKQCPFCRTDVEIDRIHKNRMLYRILQQIAKKRGQQIKINQNPQKEFYKLRRSFHNNNNDGNYLAPDQSSIIIANNNDLFNPRDSLNAALLNQQIAQILNVNPNQQDQNQSLCSKICARIQLSNPLYCFAYFLVMFYNVPFVICQLNYAFTIQQQTCMDQDYGIGMTLRQWMFSSSLIGLSMFTLQLLVIFFKICCPNYRKCPKTFTILNIIGFLLKFLGYNLLGFVVYGNIDQQGQANCNGSVLAYMEAVFIIQIVIICALCSFFDRRR